MLVLLQLLLLLIFHDQNLHPGKFVLRLLRQCLR